MGILLIGEALQSQSNDIYSTFYLFMHASEVVKDDEYVPMSTYSSLRKVRTYVYRYFSTSYIAYGTSMHNTPNY